ncbi:MAG: CsbD family protein [Alphaproteobacteria bacterium]|nr:CsbD family protein [Alphaproteobacteria bacterium]
MNANSEQMEGKWDQIKGKIKEKWGELTDDDIALYNGRRDQFFGKLKERYGIDREDAEKRMKDIMDTLGGGSASCCSCGSSHDKNA